MEEIIAQENLSTLQGFSQWGDFMRQIANPQPIRTAAKLREIELEQMGTVREQDME